MPPTLAKKRVMSSSPCLSRPIEPRGRTRGKPRRHGVDDQGAAGTGAVIEPSPARSQVGPEPGDLVAVEKAVAVGVGAVERRRRGQSELGAGDRLVAVAV